MSINIEKTQLLLGDIIKIYSPTNTDLHEQIYLIEYRDDQKLKLLGEGGKDILTLDERGFINDQSIVNIDILYRNDKIGYVKQNNLELDNWINIYIGGDLPRIIVGLIVDIEEDMIKIKSYPDDDYLYIDFGYQGIPEEYNIEKIELRDPPGTTKDSNEKVETELSEENDELEEDDELKEMKIRATKDGIELEEGELYEPEESLDRSINEDRLDDELKEVEIFTIGEKLGKITQYERLSEDKKKYGLDIQINDLVENMINKIPFHKRNDYQVEKFNVMIERFINLRNDFSRMDENSNPIGVKKLLTDKPIVNKLINKSINYSWILPVTKMTKKIYDIEQDEVEADDILQLTLSDTRSDEYEIYQNYNSSSTDNKYKHFTRKMDSYTIPFKSPLDTENLYIKNASKRLDTIVNNFGDFETTIYSHDDSYKDIGLNSKKYFNQVYIDGLKYADININKINEYNSKILKLTDNDELYISSFIELPLILGELNRPKFKSTNIYDKSKNTILDNSIFSYLNNTKIFNEDLSDTFEFNGKNPVNYVWNKTNEKTDNFKKYLETIIPSTYDLHSKIITNSNKYSIKSMIDDLIPYGIEYDDMNYENYKLFKETLKNKIDLYFDNFKGRRKSYNYYNKLNIHTELKNKSVLLLTPNIEVQTMEELLTKYLINKEKTNYSNFELMNKMINIDNGKYLQFVLKKQISSLKNPDYKDFMDKYENPKIDVDDEKELCNAVVVSKKYYSIKELEDDNNKKIYYDKKLDDTQYDIIKAYDREKKTMKEGEFYDFFVKKLQDVNGLSESSSKDIALNMIEGKKRVRENDYAILYKYDDENEKSDNLEYYKRIKNEKNELWQLDEKVTREKGQKLGSFIENTCDNDLYCYPESSAMDISCISKDNKSDVIDEKLLKEMEVEYYKKIYKTIDDDSVFEEKYIDFLGKLNLFKEKISEKYNNFYVKISKDVEEVPEVKSPYKKKLDQIFNIENLVERYKLLLLFQQKYTRNAIENEDKYYYYCKESGISLLPTFYIILANAYVNKSNYRKILEELCDLQGVEEDGVIRDKYTGYPIKEQDFNEDEGYDELGFKVVTKEVIIDDNEDMDVETLNQEIEYILSDIIKADDYDEDEPIDESVKSETEEIKFVKETIERLEKILKINIGSLRQFILLKTITFNDKYKKTGKEKTDNKSNFTIFVITLSLFLVSLQLLYPNINLKRTIPNCTVSIIGYPIFKNDDNSSVEFIACLVKQNEKTMTYNTKKLKISDLRDNIRKILEKIVVPELKDIIHRKRLSLKKLNTQKEIIAESSDYILFHPPLMSYTMKSQTNVTDSVIDNINDNSVSITDTLNIIKSKNMSLAYDVIYNINSIVKKEDPLLKNVYNEPYLENACCVDGERENAFYYFKNKNKHIDNVHTYIKSNNNVVLKVEKYIKPHQLYIDIYTRFDYPIISDTLEKETIDNILRKVSKIENIDEIVNIHKNKLIKYTLTDNIYNSIELLRNELSDIKSVYGTVIANDFSLIKFKQDFYNLIDVYSISLSKKDDTKMIKSEILKLREYLSDYLDKYNDEVVKNLKIKKSSDDKNKLYKLFNVSLKFDKSRYNMYQYMKYMINIIEEIGITFPLMIINNVSFKDKKIPVHWNLNRLHIGELKKNIESYYSFISPFIDNDEIKQILNEIKLEVGEIVRFLKKIPYYNTKDSNKVETIFNTKLVEDIFYFMFVYVIHLYLKKNNNTIIKKLLVAYLETIYSSYKNTYVNKDDIMKKVLRDKEKEKDKITRRFKKELSEEEKEISLLFKGHKLGEWGVGLQKEFVRYDKNMDEQRRANKDQEQDLENNYIGNITEDYDQEIIGY
tara:strand:+ start:26972 stop:32467 length:5496 start_codon:yes stop_codon:yes gene_type:complete